MGLSRAVDPIVSSADRYLLAIAVEIERGRPKRASLYIQL